MQNCDVDFNSKFSACELHVMGLSTNRLFRQSSRALVINKIYFFLLPFSELMN